MNTLDQQFGMGARQYSSLLGRFLEVDPVLGGNANDYTYPLDPLNQSDLDGLRCLSGVNHYQKNGKTVRKGTKGAKGVCRGESVLKGVRKNSYIKCFKRLGCGLATGSVMILGYGITGLACTTTGLSFGLALGLCVGFGSLTGMAHEVTKNAVLNGKVTWRNVCAGAVSGANPFGASGFVSKQGAKQLLGAASRQC